MTSFRGRTIIVLFLYVILVFWLFCSKLVTTFPTGSTGRNLTHRFNPVSVVIPTFTRGLLRLIRLFPGFFIVTAFNPLNSMFLPRLYDLSD